MTLVITLYWHYSWLAGGKKQTLREQASCWRNFFIRVRNDTIYVTMDKAGRRVLP
jgi:hypothetical protein